MDATTVRVSSEHSGRILSLDCDEGAQVSPGDTLAWLDGERLDFVASQHDARLAELDFQLRASRERRKAADIQRDNLAVKLERFKALLAEHATTRQIVDDLSAQLGAADAELRAADEALSAISQKRNEIIAGLGIVETQQHVTRILAPISGTVLLRYAERGEFLAPGSPFCEIADLTAMWTRIYLSASELPLLRLGQQVEVRIDHHDAVLTGRLRRISDKAEFTPKNILTEDTRTSLVYAAWVDIPNPDGLLKIGMPVQIRVPTELP
jgi:HlyD family secretion protein